MISGLLLIAVIYLVTSGNSRNYGEYSDNREWLSLKESNEKLKTTLLLNYANNMFGSSQIVQDIKYNESCTLSLKGLTLKTPKPYDVKFPYYFNKSMRFTDKDANLPEQRTKRGVIHLYNMISCATGCDPLIYKGYGCFCGFLGSGYAVDGVDRCCKLHDWCYEVAGCPTFLEYIVPYFWKCYYNRPLCAINHGEFGGPGSCASRLCECDRRLSQCLSKFPCPKRRAICRSSPLRLLQNAFMLFT